MVTGRNDPCHCGSGKKYKKCCLATDEQRRLDEQAARQAKLAPALPPLLFFDDDDELDDLSNSVLDLVEAARFDDALAVCKRLCDEYPEVVDGVERSGLVHAEMGNHALAADFYRKALAFVTAPSRRDDYEDHDYYREQAEEQERLAGLR